MHQPLFRGDSINMERVSIMFVIIIITLLSSATSQNVHWCPRKCDCYNQYTIVDCSSRGLRKLPELSNLTTRLYLEDNRLEELADDSFANTPNLIVLTLQHNHFKTISTSALCGLPRLEEINLSGNTLHTFSVTVTPDGQKCFAPRLRELNLYNNRLHEAPGNLSVFAPNLLTLNLSYNQIDSAYLDPSYRSMHVLHTLDFHGNSIHEIKEGDLDATSDALQSLDLSDCGLVYIDALAFEHMQNLTALDLKGNLLESDILKKSFGKLGNGSKLQHLDLSRMYISNLTAGMFGMLRQLNALIIIDSGVEWIEKTLWSALTRLETLDLDYNRIEDVGNLQPLRDLRNLRLSSNKIENIDIQSLYNLEVLDLSHNQIHNLPASWMIGNDILFKLNLSSNRISTIDREAFDGVTLHTLDLCNNQLETLSSFGHLKLSNLYLCNNQISRITNDAFYYIHPTLEELDLGYNNLSYFPRKGFEDFISLQRLNLAHNNLGPAFASESKLGGLFPSLSHLQVLNLAYNSIDRLQRQHMKHLHHLTTLYLQHNQIVDLMELSLFDVKSLAKLDLSNNALKTVEPAVLGGLDYLEVVDLSNNPYDCACQILHYLHWLNTTLVTVMHSDVPQKYKCASPGNMKGKYILNYRPHIHECLTYEHLYVLQHNVAVVGVSISTLFVLCIVVICIWHKSQLCQRIKSLQYKWQIRYREVSGVEISGDPKM